MSQRLEMHIIQTFPASCLNRDETGRPKTYPQGGVPRVYVSSQCLKRAARMSIKPNPLFEGIRSRDFTSVINEIFPEESSEACKNYSKTITDFMAKGKDSKKSKDTEKPDDDNSTTSTNEDKANVFFLSKKELSFLVRLLKQGGKVSAKDMEKSLSDKSINDRCDIALFGGRMASGIEGRFANMDSATQFSIATSTHKSVPQIDFFVAMDDLGEKAGIKGAAHMNNSMFNSSTFYRYIGLNVNMAFDDYHLGNLSKEEQRKAIEAFMQSVIRAVPSARQNTNFAGTRPDLVLVTLGNDQGLSLSNAFEKPIYVDKESYSEKSVKALFEHFNKMRKDYNIEYSFIANIPELSANDLVKKVTDEIFK